MHPTTTTTPTIDIFPQQLAFPKVTNHDIPRVDEDIVFMKITVGDLEGMIMEHLETFSELHSQTQHLLPPLFRSRTAIDFPEILHSGGIWFTYIDDTRKDEEKGEWRERFV